MNEWDRGNLNFILNSSESELEDFYSWATDDDLVYALELIQMAKAELMVKEIELQDSDADEDLSLAKAYLERFRL